MFSPVVNIFCVYDVADVRKKKESGNESERLTPAQAMQKKTIQFLNKGITTKRTTEKLYETAQR